MSRIPDVIDVWIDSGTASWNCLYNDKKLIEEWFPADLVLEATEQTKLWFNMLQICSAIYFGKSCYKNVFAHGMILDFQGMKMSKSIGNVISPYEVIDKYSSDILRYYICQTSAGENINFSWDDIKTKQRNLMILSNLTNFILDLERLDLKKGKIGVEEKWILSRYNSTLKKVTELFESYKIDETIGEIEKLYLDLSRDYIKSVRDKAMDDSVVLETTKEVYLGILKMFSTICPFITESLWQKFRKEKIVKEESVHLASWPKFDKKQINDKLEGEFSSVMRVIEAGLSERDRLKVGLRWPLAKAEIESPVEITEELIEVIGRQLNVKKTIVKVKKDSAFKVLLDTKMTPELEGEGFSREIARKIQAERKNIGLKKGDLIVLTLSTDKNLKEMLEKNLEFLKERTNSKKVVFSDDKIEKKSVDFEIKDRKVSISIE